MNARIAARRVLEWHHDGRVDPVVVEFAVPVSHSDGDASRVVVIRGVTKGDWSLRVWGVDSVQALQLALNVVGAR